MLGGPALPRSALSSLRSSLTGCLRAYSTPPPPPARPPLVIEGKTYPSDDFTNITPQILSKLPLSLHLDPSHPIGIIRSIIESHFSTFTPVHPPSAIVSVRQNFDELGFAPDHPARVKGDSYYLNRETVLRTHTSAHELESFNKGLEHWLLSADVYRRDEVDNSHYPVFHQMEGASVWNPSDIASLPELNQKLRDQIAQSASPLIVTDPTHPLTIANPSQAEHDPETLQLMIDNLKLSLNSLILTLFRSHTDKAGEPLQIRWIDATFPWTAPSYEVEVFWGGEWLEILGCGVVKQDLLTKSGVPSKHGWAFGLGLERLSMILFSIPDIRLFWTTDERFLSQFSAEKGITTFRSWSVYPEVRMDMSFWLPVKGYNRWEENDYCDLVRDVAGDKAELVEKLDDFTHPKTGRRSLTYRLTYRSMERTLTTREVNEHHAEIAELCKSKFGVEIR